MLSTVRRWVTGDIPDPIEAARNALYQLVFTALISALIAFLSSPEFAAALAAYGGGAIVSSGLVKIIISWLRPRGGGVGG